MTHAAVSSRFTLTLHFARRFFTITLASLILTGCITYTNSDTGYGFDDRSARQGLANARALMKSDRYYEALPRLQQIIAKYPDARASADARYLLGFTYYKIDDSRDAIESLHEYLVLAPEGRYSDEAHALVTRLESEYQERYPDHQDIAREITSVRKKLQKDPDSLKLSSRLADLLWKHGDYDEAGALYFKTAQRFPELRRDAVFLERIDVTGDHYTVLTPSEIHRREIDRNPLSILNTASFRSGRDRRTQAHRYYAVTGQVLNRSDAVLYGVEVHVTVYGYGTTVYDTATYRLGRLNPSETRAFSTRFSNFENINNVDRYECTVSYQH